MSHESPPPVTLRDIAKSLGVSHVTISRALHDSPEVSPALRQKIQEVARQMGYRPNAMAAALGLQRQADKKQVVSAELAWINYWPDPCQLRGFREFELYWKGAHRAAEQCGYRLEEFFCAGRISPARLARILHARNIRGILIPPHCRSHLPREWEAFPWNDFCVIRFGYSLDVPRTHVVGGNHVSTALIAVENMRRLGYRRIGLATTSGINTHDKGGFLMKQLEFPAVDRVPVLVLPEDPPAAIATNILRLWIKKHRPDAILTAIACMREVLEELGYHVPAEIGLATFSVLDGQADSGIDQNSEKIGESAVTTLISMINRNAFGLPAVPQEILVAGRWVDGSSLPPRQIPHDS